MDSIDRLTADLTAFNTFAELLNTDARYRPTILPRDERHVVLADAYDVAQRARGDERRAYRGAEVAAKPRRSVLSVRLSGVEAGSGGYSEWLQVIHRINRDYAVDHEGVQYIGSPIASYDWWARGWAEEYSEFRVILGAEGDNLTRNYVQALTAEAAEYLRTAVAGVTGRVVDDNGQTTRYVGVKS